MTAALLPVLAVTSSYLRVIPAAGYQMATRASVAQSSTTVVKSS